MRNDQPAWRSSVCLRIRPFSTRNRAGAGQMAKFARCSFAKTTATCFNSFCHFHLISSVSRRQWPLIYDCIYFPFPNPQHFREKFFRCPFHSKNASRNRCPPPHDFFMLPTPLMVVIVCAGHKGIKY